MGEILDLLLSFGASLLAMFLGYLVAEKKYKNESLWKEKYQSYQEVLSALEVMVLWADERYSTEKMIPTIGTEHLDKDKAPNFYQARRTLAKASLLSKLLLCEEAVSVLNKLESDLWSADFDADEKYYHPNTQEESDAISEHANIIKNLVRPAIDDLIKFAKYDLQ